MTVDDLIAAPPPLHIGPDGRPAGYAISPSLLRYLDETLTPGQHTLETGAGTSTVLFALKGTRHTCVAPAAPLFQRIRALLAESSIPHETISFVNERSETCLPRWEGEPLDLVLIDGRHAFPSPFIDWYYTEPFLKVGGLLVVDDIQLWTGQVLQQFLAESAEWERIAVLEGRSAVFRKLADGSHDRFWEDQPFVARRGSGRRAQLLAAVRALFQGRFGEVAGMYRRFRSNRNR